MVSEAWPPQGLETVSQCPYCGHAQRSLAFGNVQDWAFGCAPGRWTYWDCDHCRSLYLDPRPTPETISLAYARYYTHTTSVSKPSVRIKQRLRNEIWFHTLGADLTPRLRFPRALSPWMHLLRPYVAEPFGLRQLAQLPKGLLIDVGCGNGDKLRLASQLGWRTWGIEVDAEAVRAAQAQGLEVRQGGYSELVQAPELADCIVCSHVLEHVHEPLALLRLLRSSLKPGGTLLLSTPNACSHLRNVYGPYWRGLEAPRHLAIASHSWLMGYLRAIGFECEQIASFDAECAVESERMRRGADRATPTNSRAARQLLSRQREVPLEHVDAIQLVCRLASEPLI